MKYVDYYKRDENGKKYKVGTSKVVINPKNECFICGCYMENNDSIFRIRGNCCVFCSAVTSTVIKGESAKDHLNAEERKHLIKLQVERAKKGKPSLKLEEAFNIIAKEIRIPWIKERITWFNEKYLSNPVTTDEFWIRDMIPEIPEKEMIRIRRVFTACLKRDEYKELYKDMEEIVNKLKK